MTRTEIITRLCEMVAELEEMKQSGSIGFMDKAEINGLETVMQSMLKRMQRNGGAQ